MAARESVMRGLVTMALIGALAALPASGAPTPQPDAAAARAASGVLADGAKWTATVPPNWNGTLLLWSHGYAPALPPAEDAPRAHRAALLAAGYAIAGSSFADAGWALESAVPDQLGTVEAFGKAFGKPRRVIAWGMSMGALVSTALAERTPKRVDGALALCGSIGGAVGMMNMGLDGAYAFRTLLAPESDIRLVAIDDDRANAARIGKVLAEAQANPAGRARVALAAVLAGLPGWTTHDGPRPDSEDYEAQEAEMAKTLTIGVFLPRVDQEARAKGIFSWNTGVDYGAQLKLSGRETMVRSLYAKSGLDLDADLARLKVGKRIAADPAAIRYMTEHYTPNARPRAPLLAVQMIGDGVTSPSLQRAYAEAAADNGYGTSVHALWVANAGHCGFDTATVMASLKMVGERIGQGRWPTPPALFVGYTPPPMLRPCIRGKACR
ncbi:alpha/beta hydrolase [Sphingomonas oligophenolica]|uniref:Alpha/beta hydrolase n=1 Tax=Sphingomonas oligophenolica TaxID=301154 RepID=A0ABU9XWX7_9SPHN